VRTKYGIESKIFLECHLPFVVRDVFSFCLVVCRMHFRIWANLACKTGAELVSEKIIIKRSDCAGQRQFARREHVLWTLAGLAERQVQQEAREGHPHPQADATYMVQGQGGSFNWTPHE